MEKLRFLRLLILMVLCRLGVSGSSLYRCEQGSPFTFHAGGKEFIVNNVTLDSSAHTKDESRVGHFEVRVHQDRGDVGVVCVRYDHVMKDKKQMFPCIGDKPIIGKLLVIRSLKDKPDLTPLCRVIVGGGLFKGCPKDATVVAGRCQCKAGMEMVADSCVKKSVKVVDGAWSAWSAWSPCSSRCGPGQKTRTRACDQPAPGPGGQPCPGRNSQTAACDSGPCPSSNSQTITQGRLCYKMRVNCNAGSVIEEKPAEARRFCVDACLADKRCRFAAFSRKTQTCTLREKRCRGAELIEDFNVKLALWRVGPKESCDPGEICDHPRSCFSRANRRKRHGKRRNRNRRRRT